MQLSHKLYCHKERHGITREAAGHTKEEGGGGADDGSSRREDEMWEKDRVGFSLFL